jgi:ABC-type maltose transport system permease subunit
MSQNLHWNTQFLSFYKNHYIIAVLSIIIDIIDSERAGSQNLEKFSRRDRDCAKLESSRRFRGSNMNPKKKSRRYRASVLIQALNLAISRFTNSLAYEPPRTRLKGKPRVKCFFLFMSLFSNVHH